MCSNALHPLRWFTVLMRWRASSAAAADTHKGRNGHVLCIGGEAGSGGAILLAAQAALRSGAGLVSAVTRTQHVPALPARCPALMFIAVEEVAQLDALLARADVVAIGPGLGQGAWGRHCSSACWACDKPRVFDAEALSLLAAAGAKLRPVDVVTPHSGEAARLLGTTAAEVQRDRFAAAAALQARLGCAVVLKGAGTLVQRFSRRRLR